MKVKINDQNVDTKHVLQFVQNNDVSKIELEAVDHVVNGKPLLGANKLSRSDILHIAGITIGVLGVLL